MSAIGTPIVAPIMVAVVSAIMLVDMFSGQAIRGSLFSLFKKLYGIKATTSVVTGYIVLKPEQQCCGSRETGAYWQTVRLARKLGGTWGFVVR